MTPLLASELCGYGGRFFGRAYDPSDLVGDSCVEILGELRYDVPWIRTLMNQAQLYAFADRGWLHNLAPVAGTPRDLDGASVGGGVRLGWWSVLLGRRFGRESDSRSARRLACVLHPHRPVLKENGDVSAHPQCSS